MRKTIQIAALILLFTGSLFAQDLSQLRIAGEAERLPGEIIPKVPKNRDANGNVAAMILVVSDLTGFSFQNENKILITNFIDT